MAGKLDRAREAITALEHTLAKMATNADSGNVAAIPAQHFLARSLRNVGRYHESAHAFQRVIEQLSASVGPTHGRVMSAHLELADVLRSAGIEGEVEVEFVIDPRGRVRPGSFRVLRSDHARFTSSVREAVATHRFLPAEVRGTRVAVRVRQRFVFSLGV